MDPVRPFALVLAGGEGKRLWPLTTDRAKPAVPFGGNYRLIDFALSNLVNARLPQDRRPDAVQEPQPRPSRRRRPGSSRRCSATTSPRCRPRCGAGPHWFAGSADAIYQNLNLIYDERPDSICVFGADHIYRMDPRQMVAPAYRERRRRHRRRAAGADRAGERVRRDRVADDGRTSPRSARSRAIAVGLPDAPDQVMASMGNYVFGDAGADRRGDRRRDERRLDATTSAATSSR